MDCSCSGYGGGPGRAPWSRPSCPRHRDRAPDRSLVRAQSPDSLVLSWRLHLPPGWRRDGLQAEGRSPAGEASSFGAHPEHVQWSRVGHSIALQGTLDPSCLRVDLICEAAAQSGAEGSLARAGMTGRDRNFLKRDRGGFPEQRMQRFLFPEPPTKFQSVERTAHTL